MGLIRISLVVLGLMGMALSNAHADAAATTSAKFTIDVDKGDSAVAQQSVLGYKMKDIDGEEQDLAEYGGEVLLVVNVASKCGLTPQYEGLQKLYEQYHERGFEILAFPANEFGKQEPGTDEEIKEFCSTNYSVTFPIFSKIVVKGEGIHPLYQYLTEQLPNEELQGEIAWNFTKFLVSRDGKVAARFEPPVTPDDAALVSAVEDALAATAP